MKARKSRPDTLKGVKLEDLLLNVENTWLWKMSMCSLAFILFIEVKPVRAKLISVYFFAPFYFCEKWNKLENIKVQKIDRGL